MEKNEMPRIELYKARSFGDKLNATFDFVRENWRPLIKYLTYILLPFSMVACLFLSTMTNVMLDFSYSQFVESEGVFFVKYMLFLLVFVLSSIALYASVYSMLQLYYSRPKRLQGLTFREFASSLLKNCKRTLVVGILSVLFCRHLECPVRYSAPHDCHCCCHLLILLADYYHSSPFCGHITTYVLVFILPSWRHLYHRLLQESLSSGISHLGRHPADSTCHRPYHSDNRNCLFHSMVYLSWRKGIILWFCWRRKCSCVDQFYNLFGICRQCFQFYSYVQSWHHCPGLSIWPCCRQDWWCSHWQRYWEFRETIMPITADGFTQHRHPHPTFLSAESGL